MRGKMTNTDPTTGFVPEREAGRILGGDKPIAPRTLQRWRIEGDGPPWYKLGNAVRYKRDELLAWADAQRRTSTAEAA